MGLSGHRRGSRLDCMRTVPDEVFAAARARAPHAVERPRRRCTRVTTNAACDAALGDAERSRGRAGRERGQSEHRRVCEFLSRESPHTRDDRIRATRRRGARSDVRSCATRRARSSGVRTRAQSDQHTRLASTTHRVQTTTIFGTTSRKFHRKLQRATATAPWYTGTGTMVQQQTRGHPRSP